MMMAPSAAAQDPDGPSQSTVAPFTVTNGLRVEDSLTGRRGDAARGLRLYMQPARTGCIGCHGVPEAPGLGAARIAEMARAPRGGVPTLDRVGARLDAAQIRLWLVAPSFLAGPGVKPSIYALGQRTDPDDPLWGGPRLTADEVEDLVAWLAGLTGRE